MVVASALTFLAEPMLLAADLLLALDEAVPALMPGFGNAVAVSGVTLEVVSTGGNDLD